MKRLLTIVALLLMGAAALQAKPVAPDVLLRAARHFLDRTDLVDATPARLADCRLYVGADGTGFVLLAADDVSRPLLGYSPSAPMDVDSLPPSVIEWMDGYQRDIARARTLGLGPSARAVAEWERLLTPQATKAAIRPIGPLLRSQWGQGNPFNNQCPYDAAAHQRALTGCVATATAQVMRYWKHPTTGRGSRTYTHPIYGTLGVGFDTITYRWTTMPYVVTSSITPRQKTNLSTLLFHVGVAVEMDYGTSGSGAYTNPLGHIHRASAETALKEHFYYNPGLFTGYKEGYTDAEWRAMIDADLEAERPVLYDGYGPSGGHAFVLDGRDSLGLYHFNWGWEGVSDGYFTLDSLVPGSDMSFSQLNSAIFRIFPVEDGAASATVQVRSAQPERGTVSGSGTYPSDSLRILLLATAAPGYRFDHWTSGNPANPIITAPTADLTDTAVFVPIHRDTFGFCRANGIAYKNLTGADSNEWAIRIDPAYLVGKERLRQVQFWTYEASGPYELRLYRGAVPTVPVYTDTFSSPGYGMLTIDIPASAPIDLADSTPLWVAIYNAGHTFPVSYSHFTGTADGSWIHHEGQWSLVYDVLPFYTSWMIRAVLDPPTHVGLPTVADAADLLRIHLQGRRLSATAPDGMPLALYDLQGRRLATAAGTLSATLPAAGIYILHATGAKPRKLVVR